MSHNETVHYYFCPSVWNHFVLTVHRTFWAYPPISSFQGLIISFTLLACPYLVHNGLTLTIKQVSISDAFAASQLVSLFLFSLFLFSLFLTTLPIPPAWLITWVLSSTQFWLNFVVASLLLELFPLVRTLSDPSTPERHPLSDRTAGERPILVDHGCYRQS